MLKRKDNEGHLADQEDEGHLDMIMLLERTRAEMKVQNDSS